MARIRRLTSRKHIKKGVAELVASDRSFRKLARHADQLTIPAADEGFAALLEIASNHRILITVIVPEKGGDAGLAASGGVPIFSLNIQSSPGELRVGVDTPVRSLVKDVGRIEAAGYKFEHAYDY